MLTARTKSGTIFSLSNKYEKENLLILRNHEKFFCPVCGEAVSLKLGNQRIYHFAHRSGTVCSDFHESESLYHIKGKLQLFRWLQIQGIPAELEYYDSVIGQRPDIMFDFGGNRYALEYQCSPIPEEVFIKRTESYIQHHYIPLWILGSKHVKAKRSNVFSLSNFNYFFLRKITNRQLVLPSYCPEEKRFHILCSIQPFSIKNATANHQQFSIHKTGIEEILEPRVFNSFNYPKWANEMEKFTINWSLHPSPDVNRFLREIYHHNLNLYLLPPEIGLPVSHSLLIQTPPIIWQTYLYLDVFQNKSPRSLIDLKGVEKAFNKRAKLNELFLRKLPQLPNETPFIAVREYFQLLERLGIIIKRGESMYQVQKGFIIPTSNREKEEGKHEFYQKNRTILGKI
ncbi:competence protein CoiA [Bacillus sp. OK048]|uniref:competence protein CoiA n=1 Tax=Bacillus sp. OK048 TaxID=1882761 RepID=UPI0008804DB5|nr:competence protein CoiA family protein [Bacillus sp. OK048]SDN14805.1 Competence protein CoiA-like family, contains a predicted nuclease domain [Bacillus sp. OK048]